MNVGFLAIELVPLLMVGSLGPGLLWVSRLPWSPLEKLCGAMGVSFVATYLAGFSLFGVESGWGGYFVTFLIFALMGLLGWRQMRVFVAHRQTRSVLLALLILLAWDFLHLAIVRNYSGGMWSGDWYEHYERMRYFVRRGDVPDDFKYIGLYLLPARPPLMNIVEAFYCKLAGIGFEGYALVSLFLNAFAFVPCCLLLRGFAGRTWRDRNHVIVLLILFMLNPSVLQNVTFTWTKAFSAGFTVLGIALYLRGIRRRGSSRIIAAWFSLGAGFLVHYSTGPFMLAIGVHYAWRLLHKRRRIVEPIVAGVATGLLLCTWLFWSAGVYGWHLTMFSNTTSYASSRQSSDQIVRKTLYNLFCSIIPHPLHQWELPLRSLGDGRDYFFAMSQTTLPMMIGSAGGIIAMAATWRFLSHRDPRTRWQRQFWTIVLPVTLVLGALTHPYRDAFGVAHVTMQPLALVGVTLVAARLLRLRPAWFMFALIGIAIDYALGILLHFHLESCVYEILGQGAAGPLLRADNSLGTRSVGPREYSAKIVHRYTFWGDHWVTWNPVIQCVCIIVAAGALMVLIKARQRAAGVNLNP